MASRNVGICLILAVLVPASMGGTRREPIDAFKAMENFTKGFSLYTSIDDSDFKCLTVSRISFNLEARKAVYVWHLKGPDGTVRTNVTFYVDDGEAPEKVTYFLDHDTTTIYTGSCLYTDYLTCAVNRVFFRGHDHCMLWVKPDVLQAVPRHCVDNYKANCPTRFPTYDPERCHLDE
ncbi:uncharacterized protein LOC119167655 [Rhipicephalus microplus]|uniref:uncharacterized protein LOC119167655 n=1 Tax=Rhipicephalus microplus TaxID=6941 RepID=UPI003F6C2EA3